LSANSSAGVGSSSPISGIEIISLWLKPAYLRIGDDGWAEFAFGVVNAAGQFKYSRTSVSFRWTGSDEGDEISGEASAELLDDGTLEIDLSFDCGDDASLTAHRQ
jgi:hypothetical protein